MTAFLYLERASNRWVDSLRAYEVIVNGEKRDEIREGEKKTIEVDPGRVEIFLKINWCKSRSVTLDLASDSQAQFYCRPRNPLTALYGVTFGRNNYMRLEVQEVFSSGA
jgi:hypothetical protein